MISFDESPSTLRLSIPVIKWSWVSLCKYDVICVTALLCTVVFDASVADFAASASVDAAVPAYAVNLMCTHECTMFEEC